MSVAGVRGVDGAAELLDHGIERRCALRRPPAGRSSAHPLRCGPRSPRSRPPSPRSVTRARPTTRCSWCRPGACSACSCSQACSRFPPGGLTATAPSGPRRALDVPGRLKPGDGAPCTPWRRVRRSILRTSPRRRGRGAPLVRARGEGTQHDRLRIADPCRPSAARARSGGPSHSGGSDLAVGFVRHARFRASWRYSVGVVPWTARNVRLNTVALVKPQRAAMA